MQYIFLRVQDKKRRRSGLRYLSCVIGKIDKRYGIVNFKPLHWDI